MGIDSLSLRSRRVWLLLTIIFCGIFFLSSLLLFRIQTVTCQIETHPCPPEINQALLPLQGRLLFLSSAYLSQYLPALEPQYQLENYDLKLPSTLLLNFKKQPPIYQVRRQTSQEVKVLSQAGEIMSQEPKAHLPTLILASSVWDTFLMTNPPNLGIHQKLDKVVTTLPSFTASIQGLYLIDTQTIVTYLSDGKVAILSLDDFPTGLERLELVLRNLTIQPQPEVREIDVRFQFPVLRQALNVPRHEAL